MANTLKYRIAHESKPLTSNTAATINIPPYGKIFSIALNFTTSAGAPVTEAAIRSEIANLRLTINGVDHVNCTPIQILDLYEHLSSNLGVPAGVASALEMNVGRLIYTDPATRDLFGLGTANVESIQVEVRAGTLSTIANVQGFTERTTAKENLGVRARYLSYTRGFNATGDDTFDTLPRDPESSYLALMVSNGASGTATNTQVKVDNITIKDPAPQSINNLMNSNNRLAPVTGYSHIDFMDGQITTRLPMINVNDFRVTTTFSVAPGAAGYTIAALTAVNLPENL